MAANITEIQVEATTVGRTAEKRGGAHRRRIGMAGLLAAILVAVAIGGTAMHEQGTSHPALPAISRVTTGAETRFLEENTITLPSALGSETRANAGTGQGFTERQVMEFDALTAIDGSVALTVTKNIGPAEYDAIRVLMENVAGRTSPAVLTIEQQKFLEENTILPGAWGTASMEAVTPLPGQNR